MRKTYKVKKNRKYKTNRSNKIFHKTIRRGRNKVLSGGSLIGQGNFGCVFRPDLTSKLSPTHNGNIVSKVVLKNNAFSDIDMS
jgi:hypothetical protein